MREGEDYRVKVMLRHLSWERAKGELRGMLHTYWGERSDYEKARELIEAFISEMESRAVI